MEKIVLVFEPEEYMFDKILQVDNEISAELFIITSKNIRKNNKIIKIDNSRDVDAIISSIKSKFDLIDEIITMNEVFVIIVDKLKEKLNIKKDIYFDPTLFRCKNQFKELLLKNEVKTPEYIFFKNFRELEENANNFSYPVIIKPSAGFASGLVRKIYDKNELLKQAKLIEKFNIALISDLSLKNLGIILEEYIDGEEYSIDTIWNGGKPICHFIMSRGYTSGPLFPDQLYIIDPYLDKKLKSKIIDTCVKAVKCSGLIYGATHIECKVDMECGDVYILEGACRPGGSGYVLNIFSIAYEYDVLKLYFLALTNTHDFIIKYLKTLNASKEPKKFLFEYFIPFNGSGQIQKVIKPNKYNLGKNIIDYVIHVKTGDIIYKNINTKYFAWIVAEHTSSKNYNDIFKYIEKFNEMIRVVFK